MCSLFVLDLLAFFLSESLALTIVAGLIFYSLLSRPQVVFDEHPQEINHFSSFVEAGTLDHYLRDLSERVHTVYFKAQLMVLSMVNRRVLFP